MITPHEFVSQWHGDALVRVAPHIVAGVCVSDEAKCFLSEAGLPRTAFHEMGFAWLEKGLPRLAAALHNLEPNYTPSQEFDCYLLIGEDYTTYICLDEHSNGQILCVGLDEIPTTFLNSSVPQLAECLLAYQSSNESLSEQASGKELAESTAALKCKMTQIDPEALQGSDCYWYQVITQIEDGLI